MGSNLRNLLVIVLLTGCSPVARIADRTNEIRNEAQALRHHGEQVDDQIVVHHADTIDGLAADIHGELPGVQDKVPAWLSTLKWWGIAVAGVAVAFMLWQSGAFTALRIAIGWLPRKSMVQAEMAADMLDPARPESEREFVAAMRARDPAFDAAYRKVKKGRQ
jgi:type II secretory pathway component PulL